MPRALRKNARTLGVRTNVNLTHFFALSVHIRTLGRTVPCVIALTCNVPLPYGTVIRRLSRSSVSHSAYAVMTLNSIFAFLRILTVS